MVAALTTTTGSFINVYLLAVEDPRGDPWRFVLLALWAGLTWGVYRRSRLAALLMLLLFVGEKTLAYLLASGFGPAVLVAVRFYFIAYAVVGAFAIHKFRSRNVGGPSEA